MSERTRIIAWLAFLCGALSASCCELCAVYNATSALGQSEHGFIFTVAEQYIPYDQTQFEGKEVVVNNPSYVRSSITHLVPGYNFSSRFGVSLNLPLTYLDFQRTDLRYSVTGPPVLFTEKSSEFGLGDTALIGRVAVLEKSEMEYGCTINLLGGVKFPTGDAQRLKDEVEQAAIFESFLPPNTPHDPLGHSITSVHQHMLALGSGSYDGVFGLTENARWRRFFLNTQFQYYLRTEGEAGFRYGDEVVVSGGPGGFLLLTKTWTLSLQLNAVYDRLGRDELLGRVSERTGLTAWYAGPLLVFTAGSKLNLTAGVDIPLSIDNDFFQSVPSYRVNAAISLRF